MPDQPARTYFLHLTNLTADDSDVTADVCWYHVDPAVTVAEYPPDVSEFHLGSAERVSLHNGASVPGTPGVAERNPDSRSPDAHRPPRWNVFGTWGITAMKTYAPDALPDTCARWWQSRFPAFDKPADRNFLLVPRAEIPTMPVAQQYPEWIAP
ncbi:hypothetical protein [Nocardia sp. NPDC004722]